MPIAQQAEKPRGEARSERFAPVEPVLRPSLR
jgi:hypothetical protein